jgi:hypothetical protein
MPIEFKREVFSVLSEQVRRQVSKAGLSEEEILTDFGAWRKDQACASSPTLTFCLL